MFVNNSHMRRKASASTYDTKLFEAQLAEAFKKIKTTARIDRRAFNDRMRECPVPFTRVQLNWMYSNFGEKLTQETN